MRRFLALIVLAASLGCAPREALTPDQVVSGGEAESQSQTEVMEPAAEAPPAEGAAAEGPGSVEVIGGDEAALREFIRDYFTPTYINAPVQDIKITLGTLPEDVPFDPPLPEGANLVASITGMYSTLEVLFDAPQSPDELAGFYQEALTAAGWQPRGGTETGPGFVSADAYGEIYCRKAGEESLTLQSRARPEGPTLARLTLQAGTDFHICNQPEAPEGAADPARELVPALQAPAEARMYETGGGGGGDRYDYTAALETSLSAAELAAHFEPQLAAAGWQLLSSGSAEGIAWSTWSLQDPREKTWGGTLILTQNPVSAGRSYATLRVERAP